MDGEGWAAHGKSGGDSMIPIQDGGRGLTCPCCQTDLQLPDGWYLTHEGQGTCQGCGMAIEDGQEQCKGCAARAAAVEAYRQTDEYREIMERRGALTPTDVLAAIDAECGSSVKAARRLRVLVLGPNEQTTGEWLTQWIKKRKILQALYEIRRKHGWRGDPPIKRPRKHPDPVLVFSRQAVSE